MRWHRRVECPMCGTWVCDSCGWKRARANRYSGDPQRCGRCQGISGVMLPTMHANLATADDHSFAAKALMEEPRYPL